MQILSVAQSIINTYYPVPEDSFFKIAPLFKARTIAKGEMLLSENSKSLHEIILYEGIVRGYYTGTAGDDYKEINVSFYYRPVILTPWCIRTINQKSIISYQALENTGIIEFDAVEFRKLINEDENIQAFAKTVMQEELKMKMQRESGLYLENAEERYLHFRQQHPELENKIPQYHIAAFLGITPISLSRIRKNLLHKTISN